MKRILVLCSLLFFVVPTLGDGPKKPNKCQKRLHASQPKLGALLGPLSPRLARAQRHRRVLKDWVPLSDFYPSVEAFRQSHHEWLADEPSTYVKFWKEVIGAEVVNDEGTLYLKVPLLTSQLFQRINAKIDRAIADGKIAEDKAIYPGLRFKDRKGRVTYIRPGKDPWPDKSFKYERVDQVEQSVWADWLGKGIMHFTLNALMIHDTGHMAELTEHWERMEQTAAYYQRLNADPVWAAKLARMEEEGHPNLPSQNRLYFLQETFSVIDGKHLATKKHVERMGEVRTTADILLWLHGMRRESNQKFREHVRSMVTTLEEVVVPFGALTHDPYNRSVHFNNARIQQKMIGRLENKIGSLDLDERIDNRYAIMALQHPFGLWQELRILYRLKFERDPDLEESFEEFLKIGGDEGVDRLLMALVYRLEKAFRAAIRYEITPELVYADVMNETYVAGSPVYEYLESHLLRGTGAWHAFILNAPTW